MKKFEDLFVDSQRKHSAPVNSSNQRVVDQVMNPFNATLNEALNKRPSRLEP
jgi:hypothetical protein